jgi:disulfide bond formation protein DsbB
MYPVQDINYFLALGAVLGQIVTVGLLFIFLMRSRMPSLTGIAESISKRGLLIGLLVSILATVLALFYSEVLGFEPCPLCWWQRVFLFPQVILLGMAFWKKDAYIAEYSIVLSIFGFGVALYQHALQMMGEGSLPCPATGVSCAQRILFEFGYVTFPMLAVTAFAFLFVVMLFVRARRDS